jgi:hypothetical protein
MNLLILLFILLTPQKPIIDSKMTFKEATKGTTAPKEVLNELVLLDIDYYSFDSKIRRGQIIVNKGVAEDTKFIFNLMLENKIPINKMIPIVKYNWDDDKSMEDNNTSAFNYRFVAGTKRLSNHALGRALDINPQLNPVYYSDGKMSPPNGKRDTTKNYTFTENHIVVKELKKRGWRWGGDWTSLKDYHHFDKLD